ncbi:MAG: DUF3320 domain-containing protein, partial [Planctomycetes bacterium]|nr:DUF3320 domain-containing protein [Planctomycetota bacterium]
ATRTTLETLGLRALAAAIDDGRLPPAAIGPAFERGFRAAWLTQVVDSDPALRGFHAREHERRIRRFAELDREVLATTGAMVVARLAAAVPRAGAAASGSSEVGILLREIAKKRRHLPLRRLFASIPNLLARLEPCMLMSPLSVAQYLGPELPPFDLVVFDEASQVTPWDAIGALSRGGACVVVGDSKQLPPTSFFQLGESADDEPDAVHGTGEAGEELVVDLESVLDECAASGFRRLGLRWHYRSRHESLITFSNYRYYDNSLLTFPAPLERGRGRGVSLVRVEGVYDRSRSRTNPKEAESVVADLLARLRAIDDPERAPSFGIVTFSRPQQELVLDLLERARRDDPGLESWFADARPEPVFVKNLENVQGDERDVILFSIGYGPDAAGKVAMNFGPLNAQGGERRLNVAITRARLEVVVHATLRPEQIDLTRTNAAGVRHLREFLEYAERGPRALAAALVLDPDAAHDSPFERDVDRALAAAGHSVVRQVGCSGYRIDLAVRDPDEPGAFLLGIECDGASYHSARTARERDRLREAVLVGLGWKLVRIWSTDWWRDPAAELARVGEAIAAARAARPRRPSASEPVPKPANPAVTASPANAAAEAASLPPPVAAAAPRTLAEPYLVAAAVKPRPDAEGFFLPSQDAAVLAAVEAVLAIEAPIHADLLCRRVAEHAGLARATARVRERVLGVLGRLPKERRPTTRGEFLWSAQRDPASWRGYRSAGTGAGSRDADAIAPEEIANAALDVLRAQIAMPRGELAREAARALGFARSGARVEAAMQTGIELLLTRDGEAQLDAEGRVALGRA